MSGRASAGLVFDLDGTISDPLQGIHRCINHALDAYGLATVSEDAVAPQVGPPLELAFRALLPPAEHGLVEALIRRYRERYARVGFAENVLYPGISEALIALRDQGQRLGVCTSKPAAFAEKILARFGLETLFDFVDGGDIGITKAMQLAGLIETGRVDAASIMIGDRGVDITAAHANGLRSAGVLWGYGSRGELEEAGAGRLLARICELPGLGSSPGAPIS